MLEERSYRKGYDGTLEPCEADPPQSREAFGSMPLTRVLLLPLRLFLLSQPCSISINASMASRH